MLRTNVTMNGVAQHIGDMDMVSNEIDPIEANDTAVAPNDNTLLDYVLIEKMFVDNYGRVANKARIRDLIANWNPKKVGTIYLSYRDDTDRYAILDGHHRMTAAKAKGLTRLPCRIYLDLTYAQEADLYTGFANNKQQTVADRFRARLEAREPSALAMRRIVEGQGLRVSLTSNAHTVRTLNAVGALEDVYRQYGPDVLAETLRILDISMNGQSLALSAMFLGGMAAFLRRYADTMKEQRLVFALGRVGPEELAQRSKMIRKSGVSAGTAAPLGRAMLAAYNSGLRTGHLPEWIERLPLELAPEVAAARKMAIGEAVRERHAALRKKLGDDGYLEVLRRRAAGQRTGPEATMAADGPDDTL